MAYTVTQSTTGVQGALDDLIYVVKDTTNTGEPKYRYVCRIQVGGVTLIKMKQLPNNSNAAVFNIQDIVSTQVYQDDDPYSLGLTNLSGQLDTTQIFSSNGNALKEISLQFGYEYALNDESAPSETLLPATATEVTVVNGYFRKPGDSYPLGSTAASEYKLTGPAQSFLSDATSGTEVMYPIADDDTRRSRAVLAFLNGNDVGSTGPRYIHITYYNGPSVLTTGYIQNSTANGGKPPAVGLNDSQSLLYMGVGPFNLQSQSVNVNLRPGATGNQGYTHYLVQASDSTTLAGNQKSKAYRFDRLQCSKYFRVDAGYTLHWWNSKGGVDSLPCNGKSVKSDTMERVEYRVSGGNGFSADGTSPAYTQKSYTGGKQTSRIRTTHSLRLSVSSGSPDVLTPLVESLMRSEKVFLSGNSKFGIATGRNTSATVQCVIKDSSIEYLEGVNDQAETYVFNVELSRLIPYS